MAQFEIFKDIRGAFRWRFQANNNEVVAQSEGYGTLAGAKNGIVVLQREAPGATIKDLT